MVVVRDGDVCSCGRQGCIEAYAGRAAIERAVHRARQSGDHTVLFDVMAQLGVDHPTAAALQGALKRGDRLVTRLLEDAVAAVGVGAASVVNLLDVDAVVIGGGLADELGRWFMVRFEAAMRPQLFVQPPAVQVAAGALGAQAGPRGAAMLARESLADG
jgi:glucokinase